MACDHSEGCVFFTPCCSGEGPATCDERSRRDRLIKEPCPMKEVESGEPNQCSLLYFRAMVPLGRSCFDEKGCLVARSSRVVSFLKEDEDKRVLDKEKRISIAYDIHCLFQ